ncbi:hypothetical protein C8R44DRAFT_811546 [Mycena epipterygia]|nr:hypothetical protein C8R44DRAFT_811546 [Mycena epipterygia]
MSFEALSWPFVVVAFLLVLPRLPFFALTGLKDPNDSRSRDGYYPSSPSDVFKVRRILLKRLPPEVVNKIIDDAKYWPRIGTARHDLAAVAASSWPNNNASLCYLITPAFPPSENLGGSGARLRVKLARFDILSNDQGWSNETEHHGTYDGSFTWFEATILRPGTAPDPQGWRRWALALGYRGFRPSRPLIAVKNPQGAESRWHVQTNRCASHEPTSHTIVWQAGGPAEGEREANGSGDGSGFIDLLAPEDRIAIIARARYPGWVNSVRSVEVVVYYAV